MKEGWQSRPWAARCVRVGFFLAPAISAWIAVAVLSPYFVKAASAARIPVWVLQALAVSLVASWLAGLAVKRLAPLPGLLSLSLLFPDEAPSRFGVALRSGSTKKLREQIVTLPDDAGQAARQALELVVAMNSHDRLTRGHMERVRAHCEVIGEEMGLSETDLNGLRWGTLLHDAGKLRVPAEILQKDGKPTEAEWDILRQHPSYGVEILAPLADFLGPWMGAATDHHERWDGGGYPAGKAGTEISLAGRICSVADAYDVITSRRSYKEKQGEDFARDELVRCAGGQFDPAVVRAFLSAGVRSERRAGALGWLVELPQLWTTVAGVPAAVTTGVVAATTVASATFVAAPVAIPLNPPEVALAFEERAPAESTTTQPGGPADDPGTPATPTSALPTDADADTTSTSVLEASTPTSSTVASPTTSTADVASTTSTSSTSSIPPTTRVDASPSSTRPVLTPRTTTSTRPAPGNPTTTTTTAPTTTTTQTPLTTNEPVQPPVPIPVVPAIPTILAPATGEPQAQLRDFTDVSSLATGELESQTLSVFIESGPEPFDGSADILNYGTALVPIPDGETVCTYILHHDPVGQGTTNIVEVEIDFHADIIGFSIPGRTLPSSFDIVGVDYGDRNAIETTDMVGVDGSRLQLSSRVKVGVDRVRVFTACGP